MNQATETNATQANPTPPAIVPKDVANGVTRPKAGSLTARVWQICDEQSTIAGAPAERAKVIEQASAEGINAATAATQHGKWRKYHGLVADTPEAKAEKAAVAAKAKAEKAAKKEAAAKAKAEKAAAKAKAEAEAKAAAAAEPAGTADVGTETGEVVTDVAAVA
jgi:membrane protein involved in colicin uptake